MSSQILNGVEIKVAGQVLERRDPSKYKPIVPKSYVEDVALRLYGMKVVVWKEMNSFDDRNYHIFVDSTIYNKFIKAVHPLGYVLKILNSLDSKSPGIIDSQHKVFKHMIGKGIPVPEVVQNVNGATWSFEMIPSDQNSSQLKGPYIIQILKFIEGNMIFHKPYLPATLFNIGVFAGRIHNGLEDFENKFVRFRTFIWSLEEMSALTEYCSAVQDKQNLDLVQKVIQAFKDEVTPKYSQLNEGYLHGDMNEQNILVKEIADTKTDDKQCCDVTAFIDWGHMTYSYRIFDIAIMIAYLSIQSKEINQLDVGGHILAGYLTERTLNHDEMDVLKMCICARLAQSLVIGAYAHQKTPSNAYAITTAESGWPLLRKYWQTSKSELLHRWNRILNAYKANT